LFSIGLALPHNERMGRRLTPSNAPRTARSDEAAGADHGAPRFGIGEIVSDLYEVRGLLGAGGMGQVFDAHDRKLGRRVALKVVLPSVDVESLYLEGRALAAISHPSVITVHSIGVHRSIDYLVLEHVRGVSLFDYIRQRRERSEDMTAVEVTDLLIRVLEGLVVVHGAGLTHRDIKPGNIMLAPGNRVVLMDFGLTLIQVDPQDTRIVGSIEYMAPEALMGQVTPEVAPLVDLYAVGVIAYEMLAGTLPYTERTPQAHVKRQMCYPVPDVGAALGVDGASGEGARQLSVLITELLARNPDERPQSAEAVLWRLRSIRDQQHVQPGPVADAGFRVLIVDDDEDMHALLATYVRAVVPSADIETVGTGKDALRSVRARVPNVILLDLGLPDVNGVEVYMVLRGMNVTDRCKIIAVSARAGQSDEQLLKQFGVALVRKGPRLTNELVPLLDSIKPALRPRV
jgi:serine/threonine protein kinase